MAKLTAQQYKKLNDQAKNGFKFDLRHFLTWSGEKRLIKDDPRDNGTILEFVIQWFPEFETVTNQYGVTYNRETGRSVPALSVDLLVPSQAAKVYVVHSVKSLVPIGSPSEKKQYSTLCKLSGDIDPFAYFTQNDIDRSEPTQRIV